MTIRTLDCAQIRSDFVAGRVPAGPELDAHLRACPHCPELFENDAELGRRLAQAALPAPAADDLFALVERDLGHEVGARARLRALPTRVRAALLSGAVLLLAVLHLVFMRRVDFAEYSPLVFWGVAAVLGCAAVLGAWRLLRGANVPLGAAAHERWLALGLLLTPAAVALLVPLGTASPKWLAAFGSPGSCFSYGAVLVLPLVCLYWLFERRDRVPLVALVSAGALAGVAANLLLFAHCPSAHLGHLLLGHATVGVAWVLVLAGLSRPLRAR